VNQGPQSRDGSAVAEGYQGQAGRFREWLADENGADLIEYMLLASFLAIAGWIGMQVLGTNMNNSYRIWDYNAQQLWEPLDPVPAP
jgi:Flp pilus assembly pilin Flp